MIRRVWLTGSPLKMPVYFDGRWTGPYGIGRFSGELERRIPAFEPLRIIGPKYTPLSPIVLSVALAGKRDGFFFSPAFHPPLRSPIPVAFTVHDLIPVLAPEASNWRTQLYFNAIVRPAVRNAWRILTVSEHSKQDIVRWAGLDPQRIRVVGNGVSPAFSPDATPFAARKYFLHVGRRAPYKNITRLLTAFAMSRAKRDVDLMFTGPPDKQTMAAARALKVDHRIQFSGFVTDDKLAEIYRSALCLVFPSLYEGFGLPIVEAMAAGTPVITSGSTSTAEVAGAGNALLVDPHHTDELCAAMDRLASDSALWEKLRSHGLLRAREHQWDEVAARVSNALGLVKSPNDPAQDHGA